MSRHVDSTTAAIATMMIVLLVFAGSGRVPATDAAPPPPVGSAHGAAGSGRNGSGGSIAPSPTMRSWPGTGANGNGGPFSFVGAHHGSSWQIPASNNNSHGVGYCVMEDVAGGGTVSLQPDPAAWDVGEQARAAALMSTFGGDRVVPYGIDASGPYDVASGEWHQPMLFGGGEYTRRRHVAVNFGVRMSLEDVSPTGAVAGLKLARDTSVVDGSGGEFSALRNGYVMAQHLADVADAQHAIGGVHLELTWATPDGAAPTRPGTYPLEVRAVDATDKPVGFVPIVMLSDVGIGQARTVGAVATVNRTGHSPDSAARWAAAAALGWPTMDMAGSMATDPRFGLTANPSGADITDESGTTRFEVTVIANDWQLAFHTQAPTADVSLYAGTGVQGQVTWTGPPQSASVHLVVAPPPPPAVGRFVVRKVLDAADVQGARDMSGFVFEATAADGATIGPLETGIDGRTPPIDAAAGTYTITELGRPAWADGLGDGEPVTFLFDADGAADELEVAYTNHVPTVSITTAARDASDSDQVVDLAGGDATILDTVSHTALVPGTEYIVSGELMVRPARAGAALPSETVVTEDSGPASVASSTSAPMIRSGITGSTTFVPSAPDGDVDVEFTVPADSPLLGHVVVVYQHVLVASSGRIVATHADPDAPAQTLRFVHNAPPTTLETPPGTSPLPTTTIAPPAPPPSPDRPGPEPPANPSPAIPSTATPTVTPAPVTPATGPPDARPPAVPALASTGSNGANSTALGGAAVVLLGAGLLLAARRPHSSRHVRWRSRGIRQGIVRAPAPPSPRH